MTLKISQKHYEETNKVINAINTYGAFLCSNMELPTSYTDVEDFKSIIKLLDFHPEISSTSVCETILDYINICREYMKKRIFIFVNIRSLLSTEEFSLLYKNLLYENYNALFIERYVPTKAANEKLIIIDCDLCIL